MATCFRSSDGEILDPVRVGDCLQKPMLDLLHKHLDNKGKQAKLKSPQELQDLLDVTRQLLADLDLPKAASSNTPEETTDQDEIREKFRIVKVGCSASCSDDEAADASGLPMIALEYELNNKSENLVFLSSLPHLCSRNTVFFP